MTGSDGKRFFDDGVAQVDHNKFQDQKPHQWVKATRNYLIFRCPEGALRHLKWAQDLEKQGHCRVTVGDVFNF